MSLMKKKTKRNANTNVARRNFVKVLPALAKSLGLRRKTTTA